MTIVYSLEAYGKTVQEAAEDFARNHFVERREIYGEIVGNRFQLVDGNATYCVVLVKGIKNISISRYDIVREDK